MSPGRLRDFLGHTKAGPVRPMVPVFGPAVARGPALGRLPTSKGEPYDRDVANEETGNDRGPVARAHVAASTTIRRSGSVGHSRFSEHPGHCPRSISQR